jgi:WD repeat-containing protein 81
VTELLDKDKPVHSSSHPPCQTLLTPEYMNQLVKELYGVSIRTLRPSPSASNRKLDHPKSGSPLSQENGVDSSACGKVSLSPLIAAVQSNNAFYLIYNYHRFNLFDCIIHSPAIIENSTNRPLFILYQLLNMVSYCHGVGMTLGDINMKNIYIDGRLWIQYYLPPSSLFLSKGHQKDDVISSSTTPTLSTTPIPTDKPTFNFNEQPINEKSFEYSPPALSLSDAVMRWQKGELSNYDYIMVLNYYSGRRLGDPNNHPIFPWVTDFVYKNANIRNFSCSKYRQVKGDRQLDFTYQAAYDEIRTMGHTSEGVVPHHIGDISSDVTYYVYLARQTPKEVLCDRVRPRWVPEEYPSSISKLYEWTPDESIPEFFSNPEVFYSIHEDLPDLAVPDWSTSPEQFVQIHRCILESDRVSSELHHWIDIVFGYKLVGEAAVKAKNVYLSLVDDHTSPTCNGIVQLFRSSHPKRIQSSSAPLLLFQWQHYLNMSSLMSLTSFDIGMYQTPPTHDTSDSHEKTFTTLLNERSTSVSRLHHKSNSRSGIALDDGSFEHVGYPLDTAAESLYFNGGGSYDTGGGMLSLPSKSGAKSPDQVLVTEPTNKQGLLRGILRPRRPVTMETVDSFDWQFTTISIPKDTPPLQPLLQIEELSHFLAKSCRNFGDLCSKKWEEKDLLIFKDNNEDNNLSKKLIQLMDNEENNVLNSFKERAMLDLAAVTCIAVELTCNKYIRATLPLNCSLKVRYKILQELLNNGQLHVPFHIRGLVDQIFGSDGIPLVPSIIPNLSATALIQQFIPLISFPKYFELLYHTLSEFESWSKTAGLSTPASKPKVPKDEEELSSKDPVANSKNPSEVISFITDQLESILPALDNDGLHLFMLYLFPLFEHPSSCFEAIFVLFDPLSKHLGQKWIKKFMIPPFLYAFDTFENPSNKCRMLSRTMAEKLIEKFSLATFLMRFLSCIIEAVIEPLAKKISSRKSVQTSGSFFSSSKDAGKRRASLSRLANTMSPKLSLSYNWDSHLYESDEEDELSDPEADFSFPEVSLLASKVPMFGVLAETDLDPLNEVETSRSYISQTSSDHTASNSLPSNTKPIDPFVISPTSSSVIGSRQLLPTNESLDEEDPLLPSSLEKTHEVLPKSVPSFLSSESLEEKETGDIEEDNNATSNKSTDPKLLAISSRTAEVASDCLIWLIWRLGPILATKHIAHPLLDNIHRCYTGVCQATEHNNIKFVLNVLSSMINYYGQEIILKLYLPFIKKQVAGLAKRTLLTLKSEANIAASVSLLEMSVNNTTSCEVLLEFMEDTAVNYFKPLFQVLSSKILPFPSGSKARMTICHSTVELLKKICEKLGRQRSSEVVMNALQYFFNCFSTAHNKDKTSTILTPVEGYYDDESFESILSSSEDENPTAVSEVKQTFSAKMVHCAYVDFCKLIGQISLTNHLHNIDVIEELHASYSQGRETDTVEVPLLLGLSDNLSSDSNSSCSSDSDLDIAYQLGPSVALQGKRGLGPDSTSFGQSSWLVDEPDDVVPDKFLSLSQPSPSVPGAIVSALRNTLSSSTAPNSVPSRGDTGPAVTEGSVSRGSALFDAKFGILPTSPLNEGGTSVLANDIEKSSDCKLKGNWAELWKSRVDHGPYSYESFSSFKGSKLQSYHGHKSAIRSIYIQDDEHMFLSGSKDRTVRLWSLHNQGNENAVCTSQLVYSNHQRTISNVGMVNNNQALSCDGSVHLWDVETAYCIHQFVSPTAQFLCMEVLKENPFTAVVSTTDFHIRFIDTRIGSLQHLWKTHFQTGNIRFLAPSMTWLAAGNINGTINTMELRTGELLNHWKPSDKWPTPQSAWSENLFQLKITERGNILTSVGNGMISLWKPTGRVLNHFRGL